MPKDSNLRTVTCPSCGAPLEMPAGQTTIKCKYCGATIERPPEPEPAPPPVVIERPPQMVYTQMTYTRPARPASRAGVVFLYLVVLLLVAGGGMTWYLLQRQGGSLAGSLQAALPSIPSSVILTDDASLLPSKDDAPPDVIAFTYDTSADNRALARFSTAAPKLVWRAAPVAKDTYSALILTGGPFIYTVDKTRLLAMNPDDGAVAWETSLADEVSAGCEGCFRLLGERVIALTNDGVLQSFNARTGQSAWSFRLHNVTYRLLLIAGQPAVFDRGDDGTALLVFNPVDGKQVQRLAPTCGDGPAWASGPDASSTVVSDEAGPDFYILYGSSTTCLERWDAASGTRTWQTELDDNVNGVWDTGALLTERTLYFAQRGLLMAADTATGAVRPLADEDDYDLLPLAVENDRLLVRAKRTRGTTRFELWGLDSTSGQRLWQHVFENGEPLDEPDRMVGLVDSSSWAWTWQLVGGKLILLQAQADPHQLVVDTLNPQDGVSAGQKTIPLSGISGSFYSVPTVIAWKNDRVWLVLDNGLYGVDYAAGTVAYTWR